MEGGIPVLTERKDIKTWRYLCSLETSAARGSKKNTEKLRRVIDDIQKSEEYANPKIVMKVIDLVDLYLSDEMHRILLDLLEKCRITDSAPQLKAADKLINMGFYDSAKIILERMTLISDMPLWNYLIGLVDRHEGDDGTAKEHFTRCFVMDDLFIKPYLQLEALDPEGGWKARRYIAQLMNGDKVPENKDNSGRIWELFNAYWIWKNRGSADAAELLKRMVREGIENDVDLALARIYSGEEDYQKSVEYYRRIIDGSEDSFGICIEAANVYIRMNHADEAAELCERLMSQGINDRRVIETMIRATVLRKDRSSLMKYTDMLLYNDYADFDAYVLCTEAFIEMSMHPEASGLISRMSALKADVPVLYLLSSKNDYNAGRYPSALSAASKAVRRMPNDREYILNIAKIQIATSHVSKAQKYLNRILAESPSDRDALLLIIEAEKMKSDRDYVAIHDLCQKILDNYPDDIETIKTAAWSLEKQKKFDEALDAYRSALAVKNDDSLFLGIIDTLFSNGRYEDIVQIASENTNIYGGLLEMWVMRANSEYILGRFQDAAGSYARAIEIDPNNPVIWHSKGMAEEKYSDYDNAEVSFDRAVLMDLDNQDYWISKAAVDEKKGDYTAAINSLNRVISIHPENVYSLMRKASILIRLGKIEDAEIFVELASRIEPQNMKIQTVRRDIYHMLGDTENTKNVCNSILKIDHEDTETMKILASTYKSTGMVDEALKTLAGANKINDSDIETLSMMREIYDIQAKYREEISTCKRILALDPDNRDIKSALADAYIKTNQIEAAKIIYDELHSVDPGDAQFSLKKAQMSSDKDALAVLKESLESDPDNQTVLLEAARLLFLSGEHDEAREYIERAIAVDETALEPHIKKIQMAQKLGNYEGMLAAVSDALSSVKTKEPVLWKYLGYSQMMLGDLSNAMISLDTTMKMGVETSEIYLWRGMCQEAMGNTDAAVTSYNSALRCGQSNVPVLLRLASISLTSGRDVQAVKYLDKVLENDPAHDQAITAKVMIYAAKGNTENVRKIYDMCISGGASEETKKKVADIWGRVSAGETVAMPVIPLEIVYVELKPDKTDILSEGAEEIAQEEAALAEPAATEDKPQEEAPKETEEQPETAPAEVEQSAEETGEEQTSEVPKEEERDSEETEDAEDASSEKEEPKTDGAAEEETVQAAAEMPPEEVGTVEEIPVPEEKHTEEDGPDVSEQPQSFSTEEEDVELGFFVVSSDDNETSESFSTNQPEVVPIPAVIPVPAEAPAETAEQKEEEAPRKYTDEEIHGFAISLLRFAYENEDATDEEILASADIPEDAIETTLAYLGDSDEYGHIDTDSSEFEDMEEYSKKVIIGGEMSDLENDPVVPLGTAFFTSEAGHIGTAKRIVSYIYEAMTCNIPVDSIDGDVTDAVSADDSVYDIMKKHGLGVYRARAAKILAGSKNVQ